MLGLDDGLGRARHGRRDVPDHVGARHHQEPGEHDQRMQREAQEAVRLPVQERKDVGVQDIRQDEQRDDRGRRQRDQDLLLDALSRERDIAAGYRHASHYFCWPRPLSM